MPSQGLSDFVNNDREIGTQDALPQEYKVAFKTLWEDRGVQEAILRGNEYALHDNLE